MPSPNLPDEEECLLVSAVDVFGCQQLIDSIQVAFLGSVQQGPQKVIKITILLLYKVQASQVVTVTPVDISTMLSGQKTV